MMTPIQRVCKNYDIPAEFLNEELISILLENYGNKKKIGELIKNNFPNFKEPLMKFLSLKKRGYTLEKCILVYGKEEGERRFNSYREKHRFKNTLEGKKKKYGWSEKEFLEFNKKRSVTLENLQKKYGEEEGLRRFNVYREKQAYTNTEAHLGPERYKEVNKQKAQTLPNYIRKYGLEEGTKNFNEYLNSSCRAFYSKKSQVLFDLLVRTYPLLFSDDVYYATKNNEYGIWSYSQKRYYKYDFVDLKLKIAIEFNGDHYHGNPLIYKPEDKLFGRGVGKYTAMDMWKKDDLKIKALQEERNIDVIVIWESEFDKDPQKVLEKIYEYCSNR